MTPDDLQPAERFAAQDQLARIFLMRHPEKHPANMPRRRRTDPRDSWALARAEHRRRLDEELERCAEFGRRLDWTGTGEWRDGTR